MSSRGRRYDEDERWDETDTAQRRQQFFEGPPPSTALTRGPSTRTRTNDPYAEPSSNRDDRRRSAQSGNTDPYTPRSLVRPTSRSRPSRDDDRYGGPSQIPSSYADIEDRRRRDRERSPPPESMITRAGDSARRDRSLSRTRYDKDRDTREHDDRVARERALAKRRSQDTADEARMRRARQAEDERRSSRYDDDRSRSRDGTRRSGTEVARRAPDRDPNRTTRLSSQERRDRRGTTTGRRSSRERERDRRRDESDDRRRRTGGRSSGDTRRSDRRRSDPPSSGGLIDKIIDSGKKFIKEL